MQMKVKVPKKNYGITELYDTIATTMGYRNIDELEYDCCKVSVAMNIQEGFFKRYREENQDLSGGDFNMSMAMMLLNYGPKVDESLADNEVEVLDGFICKQKGA
jgi:hypothetical protein